MSPLLRGALAVLAGSAVAMVIVSLSDLVVGRLHPLPAGTDVRDAAAMSAALAALPTSAFLLLLAGWVLASAVGAFVAVRVSAMRRLTAGLIVAALFLLATVLNLAALPHPGWMWPAALVLIPLAGWAGARGGRTAAGAPAETAR